MLAYKISTMWGFIYLSRGELNAPLQFFAILNMLAALQYISHASSTLWCPLDKDMKCDTRICINNGQKGQCKVKSCAAWYAFACVEYAILGVEGLPYIDK